MLTFVWSWLHHESRFYRIPVPCPMPEETPPRHLPLRGPALVTPRFFSARFLLTGLRASTLSLSLRPPSARSQQQENSAGFAPRHLWVIFSLVGTPSAAWQRL